MSLLATKLYLPPPRRSAVDRPRLVERLDQGLQRKLTLISAPAGFGKTTLASTWAAGCGRPAAWLSLDAADNDPQRFLSYLVAALQSVVPHVGAATLGALRSPQPPPPEAILTALINELAALPQQLVLVLDDYHLIESRPIDQAISFLVEHLPPQLHLAIATREDPQLPLARLRARGQLSELRAADLRFTLAEAASFLNQVMGLGLDPAAIAALETRTEGWIAGLQLAALSLQGQQDAAGFIASFAGTHRFVLDYLLEEVLSQQPAHIQDFLLRTSVLERLCGPLCDAVLGDGSASGQQTLAALEQANLFIVPLDAERRWYRYHHLFADLLRQRLGQGAPQGSQDPGVAELHIRASAWYEDQGMELEAFHHAAAAHDIARAERLIEGKGMPLQFRGALGPILSWLRSLPETTLDATPSLWVTYASVLLATGQTTGIEERLQAAEAGLRDVELDVVARDQLGRIAATRATLAITRHDGAAIIAHSQRALEYLRPDNLPFRTSTTWKLGLAYQMQGDRAAAARAFADVVATGQASGNLVFTLLALTSLGSIHEAQNQLQLAAETYRGVVEQAGDLALPAATCESRLGLARIAYEWNDLDAAHEHWQQGARLAKQLQNMDRPIACEIFGARLRLARGDVAGAAAALTQADHVARQRGFVQRLPEIAEAQVLTLLRQGQPEAAAELALAHDLPLSQARVQLALGNPAAALAALEPLQRQAEAGGWADLQLKALLLQALAREALGEGETALQLLGEALARAAPGGLIRSFLDEGPAMGRLLAWAAARANAPDYLVRLLAAVDATPRPAAAPPLTPAAQPLIEPLSERELEILQLIAQGLSNQEIGDRLCLALSTVKGHNLRIFGKLDVQRRTEAIARARELGLL